MSDDTTVPFLFPAVGRKKVTAAFDGGRLTSDGGVMLLGAAEHRLEIAQRLAPLIADPRDPLLVTHSIADILRARMLAIACATRMPTTSIIFALIPASNWHAADCQTAAAICAPNRPCRAGRMRPACAR